MPISVDDMGQAPFCFYLVGQNIWAQLMEDGVVLISPPIFGISPASVTIHLQENNVSWFQHHSARVVIIISLLSMCFKYVLMTGLIQSFGKMLLKGDHITVNMYNMPLPNSREQKINREPRVVPK